MARTRPAESAATQQRLRDAAVELFADKGFFGTGIRDIATSAGTTLSSLYHFFGNKDDLLVDIMVTSTEPLRDAAIALTDLYDRPEYLLSALIEQHVWAHASDRLAKVVSDTEIRALEGKRRERVLSLRDSYEQVWRNAVQQGVDEGVFDVGHPNTIASGLLSMCTSVSHWFRPDGGLALEQLCWGYSDAGLGLVRATREQRAVRRGDLELQSPGTLLGDGT
ncbi:TetR/AcrR family transcriptional regulator [Nocardia jejuensis]|uniref:TetR/AcrR family transcriptional regulator n=1 Tax=Nocardia jejuensis TaxID=328049 RepID=UPI00082D89E3|nr:TetR/AcrR family transcriptional regulator [Nocardia jejuensis]